MKRIGILCGALLFAGCASHQPLVDASIDQAEMSGSLARAQGTNPAEIKTARADLEKAKALRDKEEYEKAQAAADLSLLEYRLAFVSQTRDSIVREDSSVANGLRDDTERQELYQKILDKEIQGKEGNP